MFSWTMFGMITHQFFWAWYPKDSKFSLLDSVVDPIESYIHCFWFLLVKLFFAIPTVVELSTWIAVGPCFQPILISVVCMGTAVCALMNMVQYSDSADNAMMLRMILQKTAMITLNVVMKSSGFCGLGGPSLRKWIPLAHLLAWETERYEVSEWIANYIPLARYWSYAFGLEDK